MSIETFYSLYLCDVKLGAVITLVVIVAFRLFAGNIFMLFFFLNQRSISQSYCKNRFKNITVCEGKCYLAKQLKKQTEDSSKPEFPFQSKLKLMSVFQAILPVSKLILETTCRLKELFFLKFEPHCLTGVTKLPYIPPEFL